MAATEGSRHGRYLAFCGASQQNVVTAEAAPTPTGQVCSERRTYLPQSLSQLGSAAVVCPSPHTFVTADRPLSGSAVSEAFACWGERVAGVSVKFFRDRGGGGSSGSSSARQRLTRGQSPLGSRGGTCQVARLRGSRRTGGRLSSKGRNLTGVGCGRLLGPGYPASVPKKLDRAAAWVTGLWSHRSGREPLRQEHYHARFLKPLRVLPCPTGSFCWPTTGLFWPSDRPASGLRKVDGGAAPADWAVGLISKQRRRTYSHKRDG